MKKIVKYALLAVAATALLASCNKNEPAVFDDEEAFVAFQKTSFSVAEDGDAIKIPVTLASVAGLSESVKFEITSPETKGAKEGVNFDLLTSSGVLSFDKDHRTQYIEIQPKTDGVYTGDLKFSVNLVNSASIKMGDATTCTITINDVDHPLSEMLGKYMLHVNSYWDGWSDYEIEIQKDPEDVQKIWIYNLYDYTTVAELGDIRFFGNVDADKTEIVVPLGQATPDKISSSSWEGPSSLYLYGLSEDFELVESGAFTVKINRGADGAVTGLTFTPDNLGFWIIAWKDAAQTSNANYQIVLPGGITAKKL